MAESLERFGVNYAISESPQPLTQGDGDSLLNDLFIDPGSNYLLLSVTGQQYVELLSASINGANRHFPEKFLEVIYPLIKAGKVIFCDAVADCIETNPTVINNINTVVSNAGIVNPDQGDPLVALIPDRFPDVQRQAEIKAAADPCDYDANWAGMRYMVQSLDQLGRDFLELVIVYNDKAERIANIIDLIPLVGDVAADLITLLSDNIVDIYNLYDAWSSPGHIDDAACALFELCCQDCRYPTYDEVFDYFALQGIQGIEDIAGMTMTLMVDLWLGTNVTSSTVTWHTTIAVALIILYLDGQFANRKGRKWLDIWADIGEDNPNNGWELLCAPCVASILRLSGDGNADMSPGLVGGNPRATYNAGSDIYEGVSTGSSIECRVDFTFDFPTTTNLVRFSYINNDGTPNRSDFIRYYDAADALIRQATRSTVTGAGTFEDNTQVLDVKRVQIITAVDSLGSFSNITKLRIETP